MGSKGLSHRNHKLHLMGSKGLSHRNHKLHLMGSKGLSHRNHKLHLMGSKGLSHRNHKVELVVHHIFQIKLCRIPYSWKETTQKTLEGNNSVLQIKYS
jgi:hypothetical protein